MDPSNFQTAKSYVVFRNVPGSPFREPSVRAVQLCRCGPVVFVELRASMKDKMLCWRSVALLQSPSGEGRILQTYPRPRSQTWGTSEAMFTTCPGDACSSRKVMSTAFFLPVAFVVCIEGFR